MGKIRTSFLIDRSAGRPAEDRYGADNLGLAPVVDRPGRVDRRRRRAPRSHRQALSARTGWVLP